jgi:CHAT domain-containing protein
MGHVLLADGPATVLDLEDIRQPPAILVLSGCSTSLVSSNRSGELLGLATALLAAGSASVVMSTLPLPDAASVAGATRLHRALVAGAPIGAAVAAAGGRGDDGSPIGLLAACALSVAGRGEATAPLSSRA